MSKVAFTMSLIICKLCKLMGIPTETMTNAILLVKKLDNKFDNLKG